MDIDSLVIGETGVVTIVDPRNQKPTDIQIELYSPDSKVGRSVNLEHRRKLSKKDGDADISDDAEYLASLTKGWSGAEKNGKELKFTYEAAVKLYTDSRIIRGQCFEFIAQVANFLPKASQD